ncbi:Z-ring formation inhibitor MciZ [Falsibacillus pallidus]|uniref:Uncharacterized protein DUF3936 n=1 Tax=Falsibacillus pallidus TaxID=493781 RepID=A0A370GC17_9BACI|nr:Z-ring formation inhibitor MciZ [Falsibacillus pallidus]RDI41261.1 uncharacterized protein DUF3936 [Falsibacillus pallidus]
MKVYITEKGVVIAGKAWEIKHYLKLQQKRFPLVADWINELSKQS